MSAVTPTSTGSMPPVLPCRLGSGVADREGRLAALVRHCPDVIVVVDRAGAVDYLSPAVTAVLGYDPAAVRGLRPAALVHPGDLAAAKRFARRLTERARAEGRLSCRVRHAEGRWRHVQVVGKNLVDEPEVAGYVLTVRGVPDRAQADNPAHRRAAHDALTGLPDRTLLRRRIQQALSRPGGETGCALLFVDLDGFKQINDSLGHAAGDAVLVAVAHRLAACLRTTDVGARLGGDEFGVLLEGIEEDGDAIRVAERLLAAIVGDYRAVDTTVRVGASVGVAVHTGHETVEGLLRNADVAMYAAKASSTGHWRLFRPGMLAGRLVTGVTTERDPADRCFVPRDMTVSI